MNKLKTAIRNTEIDGFSDFIIRNFKADEKVQSDTFLKSLLDELEVLSAQMTKAILQDKTLSKLDIADNARDEAVKTLGTILAGYAVFPIVAKKEMAEPLKVIYDKYAKAGITTANYMSESSMIESLLLDFSDASLAENINALEGIAEVLASIRSAQDNFIKANDEYISAGTNKSASASSFNKPIIALVNERLIPYLNAMVISGNTTCEEFAKNVEVEINRVNALIAKRGKKKSTPDDVAE